MSQIDDEILQGFILESREHLSMVEPDLLALEDGGDDIDQDLINRVFRAIHSIKGASGFFNLTQINGLSHVMENLLMLLRDGKMAPSSELVDALLAGTDKLNTMIDDVEDSEKVDISEEIAQLTDLLPDKNEKKTTIKKKKATKQKSAPKKKATKKDNRKQEKSTENLAPTDNERKNALSNGMKIFQLFIDTDLTSNNSIASIPDFLTTIESMGKILRTIPDRQDLENKEFNGIYKILVATVLEKDLFSLGVSISEDCVTDITNVEAKVQSPSKERTKSTKTKTKKSPPPTTTQKEISQENKETKSKPAARKTDSFDTLRVNVSLLNNLMDLAGELVLGRNQLMQTMVGKTNEIQGLNSVLQHLDLVTGELQENIMMTRMQPVGSVFNKFPRVIRDLSKKMNKQIDLELKGNEVELDKSIIESLSDPLTHLIRNTADHGIEPPEVREQANKPKIGQVLLRAYHEAGMVNIEIVDDGKGLDAEALKAKAVEKKIITLDEANTMKDRDAFNLIFAPGFSTAQKVTDVSGRGVGMDVVKTNIEKLGGTVEIESTLGKGTRVNLRLPLTLAIIPSLIVTSGLERYAIPQVNIEELVRIRAKDTHKVIEKVNGANVLRLRDKLLPLVRLSDVMGLKRTYIDPETGELKEDRRQRIVDRRAAGDGKAYSIDDDSGALTIDRDSSNEVDEEKIKEQIKKRDPQKPTRRWRRKSAMSILVLKVLNNRFGLIVESVINNEEIVVKSLSKYVKENICYAGTTIMGDGSVAMILDAQGISEAGGLNFSELEKANQIISDSALTSDMKESSSILLFTNGSTEILALPLQVITRIEKIRRDEIEVIGNKEFIQYRGGSMELVRLENYLPISPPDDEGEFLHLIVPKMTTRPIGVVVTKVVDVLEAVIEIESSNLVADGLLGSSIIQDKITLVMDVFGLLEQVDPALFGENYSNLNAQDNIKVLLAEDTIFLQKLISQYLESYGYEVIPVNNGQEALDFLGKEQCDIVLTDLKMPILDGSQLAKTITSNTNLKNIPVVALTTDDTANELELIKDSSFSGIEAKINKAALLQTVFSLTGKKVA